MSIEQLALQLGVAGFLILVGYRISMQLIANWRAVEQERTVAISTGFTSITDKLQAHSLADLQSHAEITDRVSRFEGKLDEMSRSRAQRAPTVPASSVEIPRLRIADDET